MVLILMGVVGAGKTTVGELLAKRLGWRFADADDFHSHENVEKIRRGVPLTDADRIPWLDALRRAIGEWTTQGESVVLACSALKHSYREKLYAPAVQFVYLKGSRDLILDRLRSRRGHFATESILTSQLEDLEEPRHALTVEVDKSPEGIVGEIIDKLKLQSLAYPDAARK